MMMNVKKLNILVVLEKLLTTNNKQNEMMITNKNEKEKEK